MKTYLVTGGAGFIGSNFIIYMLLKHEDIYIINVDNLTYAGNLENLKSIEKYPNYTFIKADICNKIDIEAIFDNYDIDYVVNFAAESHVDRSIYDPEIFVKTNIMGTVNLLNIAYEAWRIDDSKYMAGVKFIQISTDEVYGSLGETGLFTESNPIAPRNPYSVSKASADLFVSAYASTYNLPINITRCSNNYGPYQFPEKFIPLIINNILCHRELPVYGDGMQIRDWIYVYDHCAAIDLVISYGEPGEIYNIGGNNERFNIEIIKIIISYIKHNIDNKAGEHLIKHIADRKGHDRRYAINAEKIKSQLKWTPEITLEDGINKTIEWYLDNMEWLQTITNGSYKHYYDEMYKNR